MSNAGPNRLENASADANGDSYICAECTNVSVRTEILINTLDRVIWRAKSLMFKHHMKERKTRQTIKHLMTQAMWFLMFQLHHIDVNEAIVKIIYLRETYLSLVKKEFSARIFLLPSVQAAKSFIDEISRLMKEWIYELPLKDIAFKAIMQCRISFYRNLHENQNQNINWSHWKIEWN